MVDGIILICVKMVVATCWYWNHLEPLSKNGRWIEHKRPIQGVLHWLPWWSIDHPPPAKPSMVGFENSNEDGSEPLEKQLSLRQARHRGVSVAPWMLVFLGRVETFYQVVSLELRSSPCLGPARGYPRPRFAFGAPVDGAEGRRLKGWAPDGQPAELQYGNMFNWFNSWLRSGLKEFLAGKMVTSFSSFASQKLQPEVERDDGHRVPSWWDGGGSGGLGSLALDPGNRKTQP